MCKSFVLIIWKGKHWQLENTEADDYVILPLKLMKYTSIEDILIPMLPCNAVKYLYWEHNVTILCTKFKVSRFYSLRCTLSSN